MQLLCSLLHGDDDGELILELWSKDRKVSILITPDTVECLKVDTDIDTDIDDCGLHDSLSWLLSDEEDEDFYE